MRIYWNVEQESACPHELVLKSWPVGFPSSLEYLGVCTLILHDVIGTIQSQMRYLQRSRRQSVSRKHTMMGPQRRQQGSVVLSRNVPAWIH